MDIHQALIKWFRTLGYNGEIPESLVGICNNSTKFIWEDLMENVRPKKEVENIKRNIILNRLRAKHLDKQDDFAYRVQEIEDYRQKIALQEKLKLLNDIVQEKQYKVQKLSQNCKMKDVSIDLLKKKIKENEERKYILDQKKKQLEIQNAQTEENLTKLKNVTPIEREESSSAKEITETLEKCAAKLNKIITEHQKSLAQNLQKTTSLHTISRTKRQDQSSVATYLSMREKEDFEEITRSCIKERKDKENIPLNIQRDSNKPESKKRLFDVPEIIVEEINFQKLSSSRNSKNKQSDQGNDQIDHVSFIKPPARESLGLLPDTYLNEEENNDSFLGNLNLSTTKDSEHGFSNSSFSENVFSFRSSNAQKSNDSSESVIFNFKNMQHKQSTNINDVKVEQYYKELYGDSCIEKELKSLLHANNRELIYEVLQKLIQNIKVEFMKIVSVEGSFYDKRNKVNEDDITKLQFIHLQKELKILQQKRILKDLIVKIGRRKLQVLSSLKFQGEIADIQDLLDINIKQVGLDASLAAMKKEINSSKNVENDENELQVLSSRILKIKNETANKIKLIRMAIEDLYKTQTFITSTRESVLSPVWYLRMFKTDTEWMNPLLESLWSEEIKLFDSFPLEYQRQCTFTDSKTYYRDLCTDNYPNDIKMDCEHLYMISEILESPFSPPEVILLNLLKAKMKLRVLKNLSKSGGQRTYEKYSKKYSYEALHTQESYLEFSIDKLKAIMFSSNASKTLAVGDVIKRTMEIWIQMPMKDFISSKRTVEGQSYQYYQNKLNTFL